MLAIILHWVVWELPANEQIKKILFQTASRAGFLTGYGSYGEKYSYQGTTSSASVGSFAWGGGIGYGSGGFEGGIRYLALSKQGTLSVVFIYIGYDLPLGK